MILCLALCAGMLGTNAYADSDNELHKEETVYILTDADGSVQKTIVSDWIQNNTGLETINDSSNLTDIENVKGDETFTFGNDGSTIWTADGHDVYYQGTSEQELPVTLDVSYQLDGKAVNPEELPGKTGHIVIRYSFTNHQSRQVNVGGKEDSVYIPFAMITGMILDNEVFRNIDVQNGKLVNDGDRTLVVGLTFPGLGNNLKLSDKSFDIPDYVEVSADVKDFKIAETVIIGTNSVFNELDTSELDSIDGLNEAMNKLTDAMQQLMDGSGALYDGLETLLEKSGTLVKGINDIADGASELKTGADTLNNGAKQVLAGASSLSSGLEQINSNSTSLVGGAQQVFNTLLANANSQIAAAGLSIPTLTIDNYADVLGSVISSLDGTSAYDQALMQVTAAVEANRPTIESAVTEAVRQQVSAQVTAAVQAEITEQVTALVNSNIAEQIIRAEVNMSREEYDAACAVGQIDDTVKSAIDAQIANEIASEDTQNAIAGTVENQMSDPTTQGIIYNKVEEQMSTESIKATIAENTQLQVEQAISTNMASDAVQQQIASASQGAQQLIDLKSSLDAYNGFYLGVISYTNYVSTATTGAQQLTVGIIELNDGIVKLDAGAAQLYSGTLQLKAGAPTLIDGIRALRDGSQKLSSGLLEFNREGIQKLVSALDGDLEYTINRLKATVDASGTYDNFSGIGSNMSGSVKFVYRCAAIG